MSDPICAKCGKPRGNHPYRHPFVGLLGNEMKATSDDLKELMRSALADYTAAGVDGTEGARAMREGLARIEGLETKLAKAIKAMEFWMEAQEPDIDEAINLMQATLAELKGTDQ